MSLQEHMSTHAPAQTHACDQCSASYSRLRALKRHIATKHLEKMTGEWRSSQNYSCYYGFRGFEKTPFNSSVDSGWPQVWPSHTIKEMSESKVICDQFKASYSRLWALKSQSGQTLGKKDRRMKISRITHVKINEDHLIMVKFRARGPGAPTFLRPKSTGPARGASCQQQTGQRRTSFPPLGVSQVRQCRWEQKLKSPQSLNYEQGVY